MTSSAKALDLDTLPGGDLIRQGLADLQEGTESVPALLLLIDAFNLRQLNFDVPLHDPSDPLPEHRLYHLLAAEHGDNAHSQYKALIRKLVSFSRAARCAR